MSQEGKTVVVVSGATGGLGHAVVQQCLSESHYAKTDIVCLYRNPDKISDLLSCRNVHGIRFELEKAAVAFEPLDSLLDAIDVTRLVFVHTAFNMSPLGHLGTLDDAELRNNIEGNVVGFTELLNHMVAYSRDRKFLLDIVNIDSGAAYRPIDGWSLYCSAKAYINMLIRCCASEYDDIRAVTYEPGVMDTDMQTFIRQTPEERCSSVEIFKSYHRDGKLNDCEAVACDLVPRYIFSWTAEEFAERFSK